MMGPVEHVCPANFVSDAIASLAHHGTLRDLTGSFQMIWLSKGCSQRSR